MGDLRINQTRRLSVQPRRVDLTLPPEMSPQPPSKTYVDQFQIDSRSPKAPPEKDVVARAKAAALEFAKEHPVAAGIAAVGAMAAGGAVANSMVARGETVTLTVSFQF